MLEDLDAFMEEGLDCSTAGSPGFKGLLDQPDELMDLQRVGAHSRQYLLTFITSRVVLVREAAVTVDGAAYTVREAPRQVGDGAFSRVLLSKV